jgi:hypothetical protein
MTLRRNRSCRMELPNEAGFETADAIAQVLLAEARAREAVAACRREADAIVQEARSRALAIARRSEARIAAARAAIAAKTGEIIAALDTQGSALEAQDAVPDPGAAEKLAAAVRRLAAELTGETV